MRKVVLGAGSGFWGDVLEPALEMARTADVSAIGFDHLSELTMAILSRKKARDPDQGYVPDVVPWMREILPLAHPRGIKLLSNAGGANPRAAANAVAAEARALGMNGLRIGIVGGDDILDSLPVLEEGGWAFENLDTGEVGLDRVRDRLVAANVYTGADAIVEQLQAEADVVLTGRVSDNALYVAPAMHALGWTRAAEYTDRIAAAITVGHVIECGACVTGGMSNLWRLSERPWDIGFPIAEIEESGEAVITKTPGSGGIVNEWTVKEHLLYEIQDPRAYTMPDGIADFTAVHLEDEGNDRVRMRGMRGQGPPPTAKALLAYRNGWIGEGMAFFPWPDAHEKAQYAARFLEKRIEKLGLDLDEVRIDFIGVDMLHGQTAPSPSGSPNEVGVRLAARTQHKEHALAIRRELTHLWTIGPVGTSIAHPAPVRPVVSLWPTLVPWEAVRPWSDQLQVGAS